MVNSKLIKRANSKDNLRNYSWQDSAGQIVPDFDFTKCLAMVDEDPVARGALTQYIDKAMDGGYSIIKRDSKELDESTAKTLEEKFLFRTNVVRKIFIAGKLFNNVFLEIIKNTDGTTKELNILDSVNIKPHVKSNGDAAYYESKVDNPKKGSTPKWKADEIVWFKFNDRSTGFAPVDLKALWENLLLKDWVKRYVAWLWKTGQYRILYSFKNASDPDIKDFIAYGKKHEANFRAPIILKGEMETKLLRDMSEQSHIIEFLSYLDSQTLILIRCPPIDAGIPDASGRSNADAQSNSATTHVKSMKLIIEDNINYVLFPRIKKSNSLLLFRYNDRFEEKQIIENLNIMKNIGMTDEVIKEYMFNKRMIFKSKLFDEPVDPIAGAQSVPGVKKDKDLMPSRRKDSSSGQKVIGSGEQSSTRANQLTKRTAPNPNWVIQ